MKSYRLLLVLGITALFLLAFSGAIYGFGIESDSTILTAQRINETITIDGIADETPWGTAPGLRVKVQDGSIGELYVLIHALYDRDYFYLHAEWDDPTMSVEKKLWTYNGGEWLKSGDEDRFAIFWNIYDSVEGFNIAGCAMLCHGDRMYTNAPGELADAWHWKATRTNPAGYADDKFVDDVHTDYTGSLDTSIGITARHPDAKISGGYKRNGDDNETRPLYYEPNPTDPEDARFIFQSEIDSGDAVRITPETRFSNGTVIPGYILERPVGSRGDIEAKGVWRDGAWSLEIKRKLNNGHDDDVQFNTLRTYRFGVAVMDNTGGFERHGVGHSFALGASTLEFGGLGSEEVTSLGLVRDYLITAQGYTKDGNRGLAISSVTDAQALYNSVRTNLADIDPALHIEISTDLIKVRRNPDENDIDELIQDIDDGLLTFQGQREPTKPTLGETILSIWGKVQLYVFIFMAVAALYPLYRTIQTTKTPELRHFGLFLIMVISPLILEGAGRLGILLGDPLLQNFSFTTNEYITLLWALGMGAALLIARVGFNEVDATIKSLRDRSEELVNLNRFKDMFTDIMRHDLLNPIGVIRNYVDLMSDDKEIPESSRQFLTSISRNTDNAIAMIESASRLAKLESLNEIEYEEADLYKILERVVEDLKEIAAKKDITVKTPPSAKAIAYVNEVIYDVFANLISNAIKYSPKGSTVNIGLEDSGAGWRISVSDTGEGISDEYKNQVFDRFRRTHKGAIKGSGLGLTIVKKIVGLHKGRVWVEDNPGGGSIFIVELPKETV